VSFPIVPYRNLGTLFRGFDIQRFVSATKLRSLFGHKIRTSQGSFRCHPEKHNKWRVPFMDREHIKGTAEKAKGSIKDTAGKVSGDKKLQSEGKLEKAKGSAHNVAGDIKDAVKENSK
jgi:uncharacterized protein YjbJ (UPF0337 family)